MGRKRRYIAVNTTYSTYSRCINNLHLMDIDTFKDILVNAIKETQEKYCFDLNAYQILSDHFFLVITTSHKEHTISRILQRIKSVTARRYNKAVGRCGPFWNERFKSEIVKDVPRTIVHIAYIPVIFRIVKNPRYWKYSSYCSIIDPEKTGLLRITIHSALLQSGRDPCTVFQPIEKEYMNLLKCA